MTGKWASPPLRPASVLAPTRVRFLNVERELTLPEDWGAKDTDRLWLYNLHYFNDLVAEDASIRAPWHHLLIAAWIRDNPAAKGVGWEPYPISLRVVNWIKWACAGNTLEEHAIASLAQQLRFLEKRIEWHLLGNHLLANAKALVFGGLFFSGAEADNWLEQGLQILTQQLAEQVLEDGGHFERSPMYHAGVLEDVLDLVNVVRAYPERTQGRMLQWEEALATVAGRMDHWLQAMSHPDGGIAFFNDASFAVAPTSSELHTYAEKLGLELAAQRVAPGTVDLSSSGYVRLQHTDWCVIFDAAPVGPDYQPGHAHADTLSFELSVNSERLISNSGTSTYEQGTQRYFERSTRAHNTVEIDGVDSSEVWAAFRVARRARPMNRIVDLGKDRAFASCAHDGYERLAGRPIHHRSVELNRNIVRWTDRVHGGGVHRVKGSIPLHPGVQVMVDGPSVRLVTPRGRHLQLFGEGISVFALTKGSYAQEFGLTMERPVLTWDLEGIPPLQAIFTLAAEPSLKVR